MAISKRLRFEILRRDNHTCYYCGRKPPEVEITVDHVLPQALGGTDEATNLVACCRDCNNGKTSIAPDSPLVARVDEDAIRWSAAMQAAIAKAEADHEALTEYRMQFLEAWNSYKRPAELDENWRISIETFRTRGLPIEMLIEAAHRAMAKANINLAMKFRYMCGIAWNQITEIEKHARTIFVGDTAEEDDEERHPTLKEELLPIIGQEAFEAALEEVRGWYDEDDERTEEQLEQDAIVSALHDLSFMPWSLSRSIEDLLRILVPGPETWAAWRETGDTGDADHKRWQRAAEIIADGRAEKHMQSLTAEQRDEWLQYAAARNTGGWGSSNLSDEELVRRAGRLALEVANGWRPNDMCFFAGEHIDYCPRRATARIATAGCAECGIKARPAEVGLLICDEHLERVVDLGVRDKADHRLPVTDFIVLPPEEEVPF